MRRYGPDVVEGHVDFGPWGFKSPRRHDCDVSGHRAQVSRDTVHCGLGLVVAGGVELEVAEEFAVGGGDADVEVLITEAAGGWLASLFLTVWWKRSTLPQVWGW